MDSLSVPHLSLTLRFPASEWVGCSSCCRSENSMSPFRQHPSPLFFIHIWSITGLSQILLLNVLQRNPHLSRFISSNSRKLQLHQIAIRTCTNSSFFSTLLTKTLFLFCLLYCSWTIFSEYKAIRASPAQNQWLLFDSRVERKFWNIPSEALHVLVFLCSMRSPFSHFLCSWSIGFFWDGSSSFTLLMPQGSYVWCSDGPFAGNTTFPTFV